MHICIYIYIYIYIHICIYTHIDGSEEASTRRQTGQEEIS
jgi:hypothetical protein